MAVLLVAELNNGKELAVDATAKALTAARKLGEVTVLVAGQGCEAAAAEAAKLDGAARVICVSDAAHAHGLAEPLADLVVAMAGDFSHIVLPSTAAAKNVAPRIAALLDVMVIPDVSEVVDADSFARPIYAG
ncbi:MAG TPA: electron transfer flavoprotein subunit alpha/FixB family protein, partial [Paracoccus sp. (in: a-proteobacteria)]|nr:electron transfer flavoprotein subunit alpha/FixB family protein [Paracoccus sp. (in: a-proteobacteria)]